MRPHPETLAETNRWQVQIMIMDAFFQIGDDRTPAVDFYWVWLSLRESPVT